MAKHKLFGNGVDPACIYCQHGRPAPDNVMILCRKFGPVASFYKCKKFVYDPIKRIPRRQPKLPAFKAEEFEL